MSTIEHTQSGGSIWQNKKTYIFAWILIGFLVIGFIVCVVFLVISQKNLSKQKELDAINEQTTPTKNTQPNGTGESVVPVFTKEGFKKLPTTPMYSQQPSEKNKQKSSYLMNYIASC